jgi:hypothetical protein
MVAILVPQLVANFRAAAAHGDGAAHQLNFGRASSLWSGGGVSNRSFLCATIVCMGCRRAPRVSATD